MRKALIVIEKPEDLKRVECLKEEFEITSVHRDNIDEIFEEFDVIWVSGFPTDEEREKIHQHLKSE